MSKDKWYYWEIVVTRPGMTKIVASGQFRAESDEEAKGKFNPSLLQLVTSLYWIDGDKIMEVVK